MVGERVAGWGVAEVAAWLARVGFADQATAFQECGVDGDLLLHLQDRELRNQP